MLSDFEKLWLAYLMSHPARKSDCFMICPDLSVEIGSFDHMEWSSDHSFPTLSLAIQFLAEQTRPDKQAGKDNKNVEGN